MRDYGLQRSEGVLLRYLSQAYKALLQTVPEALRTEEVDDVLDELRAMLRAVDSSLLDEWQSLRDAPGGVVVCRRRRRRPMRRARWPTIRAPSPCACAASCIASCRRWRENSTTRR